MCDLATCPQCGQRVTHPSNPGRHDSHSDLGQHIHDADGGRDKIRLFDFCDIDGAIWKAQHRLLRIVEGKPDERQLKGSQERVLPLLARGVLHLRRSYRLHYESGVFVVRGRPPFATASVEKVNPDGTIGRPMVLGEDHWTRFKRGEPLM